MKELEYSKKMHTMSERKQFMELLAKYNDIKSQLFCPRKLTNCNRHNHHNVHI